MEGLEHGVASQDIHSHKDGVDFDASRMIACDDDAPRDDDFDFGTSKRADSESYDSVTSDDDTDNLNLKRYRSRGYTRRTLSNASTSASTSIKTPSLRSGASTSTSASLRSPSLRDAFTSGEIHSLTDVNTCINAFHGRISIPGDLDEYNHWYNRYVNEDEADDLRGVGDINFCQPQHYFHNTVTVDALFRSIFFWAESPSIITPERQANFEHYEALELVFRLCTGRFLLWIQLLDARTVNCLTSKAQTIMSHLHKLSYSRARINDNNLDEYELQQEFQRFRNEMQELLLFLKVYDLMAIPDTTWPVLAARLLGNNGMCVKKMTFIRLLGAQEVQEFVDADIISYLAMVAPLLWLNDEHYEAPTIMSVADGIIDLDGVDIVREGDFDLFYNESNGAYGGLSFRDRSTIIPDEKNLHGTIESRRVSTFLKRLQMHRDPGKFGILPLVGFCKAPGNLEGVNPVYSVEEQPLNNTLAKHLQSSLPLDEVKRISLSLGLAKAVLHLHLVGWTHGNISPENILLPWGFWEHQGIPQPYFRGLRVNSPWYRGTQTVGIAQEHFSENDGPASDIEALGWLLLEVYIWQELRPKRKSTMPLTDWFGNLIARQKFALAFYNCVTGLAAHEGLFQSTNDPEKSRTGLYWRVVRPLEECLAILEGKLIPLWRMDSLDGVGQRYQDAACATLNQAIDAINACENEKPSEAHIKTSSQATEGRVLQRRKQKQVRVVSPQDDIPDKNKRSPSTTRFGLLSRIIPERLDAMLSKSPVQEPETTSANTGSETTPQSFLPAFECSDPEAQKSATGALVDDMPPPLQQPQSPSNAIPKEIDSPSEGDKDPATQESVIQEPTIQEPTIQEPTIQEPAIQKSANAPTIQIEKRMIYAVQASPEVLHAWHTSILPRLESLLQHLSTTRKPIGPTTIDLLGVGTSRETSRPTIVITCDSAATSLVRTYLKKKFTYDVDIFDLKVRKGAVRRSSGRRCCRRLASRSFSGSRYSTSIAVNRERQQKPTSGASIGACRDGEDLPPGTFGGVISVDGKLYGMTVHHLLDPLSEEDYEDVDGESDILTRMEETRLGVDEEEGEVSSIRKISLLNPLTFCID